jgi:regulator of RNase E activity RraA
VTDEMTSATVAYGFRVYTKVARPPRQTIEKFKDLPTGDVCDAQGRMGAMLPQIKPLAPHWRAVGPAVTVRCRPGDNVLVWKGLEVAEPGDVLVISTEGYTQHASYGGLISVACKRKGLAGMVTDGSVRNRKVMVDADFPAWAAGIVPSSPHKHGPGEVNVPVSCGGQVVRPGDIVVADADGVAVVPAHDADMVHERALAVIEREEQRLHEIHNDPLIPTYVEEVLREGHCEIIDEIAP